jgi:hypothetical protein
VRALPLSILTLAAVLAAALTRAAAQTPATVDQVAWLAGCWQIAAGNVLIDEQWMAPGGGVMLGMSRTVRGGRAGATEFVTLRVVNGRLVYEPNPSGQKPAVFTATSVGANRVVFENPQHDFPKRIAYERKGDALSAWIDDGAGGKRVEYPFRRRACP